MKSIQEETTFMETRVLYIPEEAARLLSIGRSKVYEYLATGTLKSLRLGRSRRISASAIEEFVSAHEQEADMDQQPISVGR